MKPMLQCMSDGLEHTLSELYERMASDLFVPETSRVELLASGKQSRFENRVGWARTYLTKAGLLESTRRGVSRITPRGVSVVAENPARIDIQYLQRFPEFEQFRQATRDLIQQQSPVETVEQSPEERLDNAYAQLKAGLIQELIEQMKAAPPSVFEKLVLDLLLKMGYGGEAGTGQHLGRPGDEGIDAVINEDKLGLDVIYIQAKRWENPVGRPTLQAFAGSLEGQRANKGVVLTTSRFTPEATEFVSKIGKKIVLVDGQRLAELMIEYKLAVQVVSTYENLKVDSDYFSGELNSAAE